MEIIRLIQDFIKSILTLVLTCVMINTLPEEYERLLPFIFCAGVFVATLYFRSGIRMCDKAFNAWTRKKGLRR